MNDLISRQAAIDAVTDELDMIDHVPQWVFDRLEKRLKQLPLAQPEPCEDAVSRKDAIDWLNDAVHEHNITDFDAVATMLALPSVTPKQRWIPCSDRLPNKQTKVLVVDFGEVDTAYLNSEGRWMDYHGDKLKDVKAWMPLPKWEGYAE